MVLDNVIVLHIIVVFGEFSIKDNNYNNKRLTVDCGTAQMLLYTFMRKTLTLIILNRFQNFFLNINLSKSVGSFLDTILNFK